MENREPPHRQQRDLAAKLKGKALGEEDVVWHSLDPAAALEQAASRPEGLSAAEERDILKKATAYFAKDAK